MADVIAILWADVIALFLLFKLNFWQMLCQYDNETVIELF